MKAAVELRRILDRLPISQWLETPDKITELINQSDCMVCILTKDLITPLFYNSHLFKLLGVPSNKMEDFNLLEFLSAADNSVLDNILKMRAFFDSKHSKDEIFTFNIPLKDMSVAIDGAAAMLGPQSDMALVVMTEAELSEKPSLTEKEKNILFLLKEGNTRQSIAEQLNISIHTVHTHIKNIYKKMDVSSFTQITP